MHRGNHFQSKVYALQPPYSTHGVILICTVSFGIYTCKLECLRAFYENLHNKHGKTNNRIFPFLYILIFLYYVYNCYIQYFGIDNFYKVLRRCSMPKRQLRLLQSSSVKPLALIDLLMPQHMNFWSSFLSVFSRYPFNFAHFNSSIYVASFFVFVWIHSPSFWVVYQRALYHDFLFFSYFLLHNITFRELRGLAKKITRLML